MRRLRTASTRRLAALLAIAAAVALTAAVAQGALTGGAPKPPPKALADAIVAAFKAPAPEGLTAKIEFSNDLLPSGSLPGGSASPLLSGAGGRLWIQKGGDFRLELQSAAGDAQVVAAGEKLTIYDASSQTVYRATLSGDGETIRKPGDGDGEKLTIARVQKALDRLARNWTLSGADPTSTAGRPTYTLTISPKHDGGLLGAAELAWDAVRGVPLRAAVHAQGASEPVLELEATEVSYAAVPDAAVRISPPAAAKVVDLGALGEGARRAEPARTAEPRKHAGIEGAAAVQRALGFDLAAPATLAGLPRKDVRLVTFDGDKGALSIYGEGLGAIAVLQRRTQPAGEREPRRQSALRLPEISIDGAAGTELATALGTIVTFEREGMSYVVAGSVRPVAAENAARELE